MAFCYQCGAQLPERAKFCGKCGSQVRNSTSPARPAPQTPAPQTPAPGRAAGFGARAAAWFVDQVIVSGTLLILSVLTVGSVLVYLTGLAVFVGPIAYFVVMEGSPAGQTIGKRLLHIRVVRKADGGALGYGLAAGRTLARILNMITLGIGYLWPLWDSKHQAFHDKAAGTLVVTAP